MPSTGEKMVDYTYLEVDYLKYGDSLDTDSER